MKKYGFYPHRMAFLRDAKTREDFLRHLSAYFPPQSNAYALLVRAHDLTEKLFEGVRRLKGEPYIEHPRRVTLVALERVKVRDAALLAACLIHDNREFAEEQEIALWDREFVESTFNYKVEVILATCTAPRKKNGRTSEESHRLYHRRFHDLLAERTLFLAKLPDRLDNLYTLSCDIMPRARVLAKVLETERHYMPGALHHNILVPELKKVLAWHRRKLNLP